MKEKEYIIKIGDLYLHDFTVDMYEIKTEFIEEVELTIKDKAMKFPTYEEAELISKKLYIILGCTVEVKEDEY